MRKVEQNMLAAIESGRDWREGDTAVEFRPAQALGVGRVTLHGNTIAVIMHAKDGLFVVRPVLDTLRRWPTVTTVSRLRALGIDAYVRRKRVRMHDGRACGPLVPVAAYVDGQQIGVDF